MEALGFAQIDAQALIGIEVMISYHDLGGNPQKTQAVIKYVTPFGFAAVQVTGDLLLLAYGQIVSVSRVSSELGWKDLLIYGGGAAIFIFAFGKLFGADRLWKKRKRR